MTFQLNLLSLFSEARSKMEEDAVITIHVDIATVLAISEVTEIFRVTFQLTMDWRDQRLTYLNLKEDTFHNMVSFEAGKRIWSPVIIFGNTQNLDQTKVMFNAKEKYTTIGNGLIVHVIYAHTHRMIPGLL